MLGKPISAARAVSGFGEGRTRTPTRTRVSITIDIRWTSRSRWLAWAVVFLGDIVGPEAFWQFLCEGRSAVGEVPPDRWAGFDDGSPEVAAALSGTTRWGSFLTDPHAFDAESSTSRRAKPPRWTPEQRLLLEVAYEALEHAGIPADSLRQTQTGVFAGAVWVNMGIWRRLI